LSLVGVAYFLDKFGDLYGNPTALNSRPDMLQVYQVCVQAWSMQWLPSTMHSGTTSNGSCCLRDGTCDIDLEDDLLRNVRAKELYTDCWWHAYRLLLLTAPSSSFVRILAVFIFKMAAVPDFTLKTLPPGDLPREMLERAILQLTVLTRLIQDFCEELPAHSKYGLLLECTSTMMHWYGCVRETSVAMMDGESCPGFGFKLNCSNPEDVCADTEVDHNIPTPSGLDPSVTLLDEAGQVAAMDIVRLWREVITLREIVLNPSADPVICFRQLQKCRRIVDKNEQEVICTLKRSAAACKEHDREYRASAGRAR
jgi:hypothetical protein